jgi:hypothetical protein
MVNQPDIIYYVRIHYYTGVFGVFKRKSEFHWELILSNSYPSFVSYFNIKFEILSNEIKTTNSLLLTQREYDEWLISQI